MSQRFQFSLKWPFVLMAGMLAGGQAARTVALAESPMLGGVPISWSARGEATFFSIGCVAAIGATGMLAWTNPALRRRVDDSPKRWAAMLVGALALGSISGAIASAGLGLAFFAMPRELFDSLTAR